MKLGVMVTTDRNPGPVCGITRAALERGHTVEIFLTDDGTRLLSDRSFSSLGALPGVTMSYCGRSAEACGGRPAGLDETVVQGSQYENALMCSESDKVIVL